MVEKILASHPDVFGAGERPNIAAMAADLEKGHDGVLRFAEGVKDLGFEEIASLARKDVHSLNRLGDGEARVVDRLPLIFYT